MRETTRKTPSRKARGASTFAAALALLALCLLLPCAASAQQWTTTPNNTDIYNTGYSTGKVGVGTQSPAYVFHVEGASTDTNNFVQGYFKNTSTAYPYGGVAVDGVNQSHVRFMLGGALKWQWRVGAGNATDDLRAYSWTLSSDVLTLKSNGFVGVGTSSPSNLLHVLSSSGVGYMRVTGAGGGVVNFEDASAASNQRLYQWRSEGGVFRLALSNDAATGFVQQNILVANSSGNVGVGTASPGERLELYDPSATVRLKIGTGGAAANSYLVLNAASGRTSIIQKQTGGANGGQALLYAADDAGGRLFAIDGTNGFGDSSAELMVKRNGSVGVGTISPAAKLDVNAGSNTAVAINATGAINASGAITGLTVNATYQDVAEWVPSTQKLAAGTVVVLDTTRTNSVLASTKPYDTRVAGVVSDSPGVILGQGGADKVKVATTGRVKVRVDATRAPIQVGDLLVTGEAEGVAMKSVPLVIGGREMHAPGTIIGKALEPLEKGTGEILVLLSLQ
jgi:hypothetical protein